MLRYFLFLTAVVLTRISALLADMTFFSFSDHPIDVVIPSVEKDLVTLNLCIRGIRENGANIRRIIVVSKTQLTDEAEWFDEKNYPFSFDDITAALAKDDPDLIDYIIENRRTGWYYQQLLKLYAPLVIPDISPNVLILDSDTIFLNPVTFINEENGGLYNPGVEYHPPYFHHAAHLIAGFQKLFPNYSGISHHMLFQRPVIEAIMEEVEYTHHAPFWYVFCQLVDKHQLAYSGASEYEIYFNYAFAHTDQIAIRELKWRNIQRLSDVEKLKKDGLHYVCLHDYERIKE